MNDIKLFLTGFACLIIPFIIGIISSWNKKVKPTTIPFTISVKPIPPPKKDPKPVAVKVNPKPVITKEKPKVDKTAFNEAKSALMKMGYKSASAKIALESVGQCNTAEEYIKKVFSKGRTT